MKLARPVLFLALTALLATGAQASVPSASAPVALDHAPSLSSASVSAALDVTALEPLDEAPRFEPGEASLLVEPRAESFHLDGVALLSEEPRRALPLSYPETRVRGFDFLGQEVVGVIEGVTLELHWGCERFGLGISEGNGVNLYAFVGQRPHEFTDPLGQQLQKFRTLRGERYSAAALRKQGWRVFWGGADHRWNAPGADAFAYNKELDQLAFFDDKNVFRKTVREASSLTNLEAGPSMEAARKAIRQSEMSQELQDDLLNRLEEGKYKKYVTAAAPESRAGRVSEDLAKQGVDFLETKVKPPRMNPGSAGIARKIGKALPYVRLALIIGTLATADSKIEAAVSLLDPTGGALNSNSVVTQEEENRGMKEDLILQQLGEDQWLRDTSNLFAPSHQPPAPAPMQKSHEPPPPTLTIGPLL